MSLGWLLVFAGVLAFLPFIVMITSPEGAKWVAWLSTVRPYGHIQERACPHLALARAGAKVYLVSALIAALLLGFGGSRVHFVCMKPTSWPPIILFVCCLASLTQPGFPAGCQCLSSTAEEGSCIHTALV